MKPRTEKFTKVFQRASLNERGSLGEKDTDGRIILKCV
jgi:hypothetical protein